MATKKKVAEYLLIDEDKGIIDVTLHRPVTIGGVQMAVIRMREPTVRDIEAASLATGNESSQNINAIANLCALSPDEIRELSFRNFGRLQEAFGNFTD